MTDRRATVVAAAARALAGAAELKAWGGLSVGSPPSTKVRLPSAEIDALRRIWLGSDQG